MIRQHVSNHVNLLCFVEQGRIVERHYLHIFDQRCRIPKFRRDKASFAPDRGLITRSALSIGAMTKLAEKRGFQFKLGFEESSRGSQAVSVWSDKKLG